jgi:hypothetical protein
MCLDISGCVNEMSGHLIDESRCDIEVSGHIMDMSIWTGYWPV